MQPRGATFLCVSVRPVAALAISDDDFKNPGVRANGSHCVAFGVGQVDVSVRGESAALGTGQRGFPGRATVSGEALFASPGQVMQRAGFQVEAVYLVALPQSQIERVFAIKVESSRTIERSAFNLRSVRSRLLLPCSGKSSNYSRLEI